MEWLVWLLALASSFWLTGVTIAVAKRRGLGADESSGVQKMHSHWVPRLGGLPIFMAFSVALLLLAWCTRAHVDLSVRLLVCLAPAFGIGLLEDVTSQAGVLTRLIFTMIAAALGWWLLDGQLVRLDLPGVDTVLSAFWPLAFVLTLIAAAGVAHAVNIIDGFNGLAGFFAVVALAAIGIVAFQVGDSFLMRVALLGAASVLGFFFWNYPFGKIFLGDAGAYFIGFLIAELSILLVYRNPSVSAWFPMLLMIYPVWETLFTMARRAAGGVRRIGQPDALHLHQLVHKRLVKRFIGARTGHAKVLRNALTSPFLWTLALMSALPAVLFWQHAHILGLFCTLFAASYIMIYLRIVRFRVPRWMVIRGRASTCATDPEKPLEAEQG